MEPNPGRPRPPRPDAIAVPIQAPDETGSLLSRESLPRATDVERNRNKGGREPPPELPPSSPFADALLGAFHGNAAVGIGSSIAYIIDALGGGAVYSIAFGLAACFSAREKFARDISRDAPVRRSLLLGGSSPAYKALPPFYTLGTAATCIPSLVVGSVGYLNPDTHGARALIFLFGMTVMFGAAHRFGLGRDNGPTE